MKNEELKPCPFCGGKAAIGKSGAVMYIRCTECRAEPYAQYRGVSDDDEFRATKEVAEQWNRRTDK